MHSRTRVRQGVKEINDSNFLSFCPLNFSQCLLLTKPSLMLEDKGTWSGRLSRSKPWGHRRRHRRSQRMVQNDEGNNRHILCLSLFIVPKDEIKSKKLRAGIGRSRRKDGSWFCGCCCFGYSKHSKSFVKPVKSISSYEHAVIKMKTQKNPQKTKNPQQTRVLLVPSPFLERSDSGWGVEVVGRMRPEVCWKLSSKGSHVPKFWLILECSQGLKFRYSRETVHLLNKLKTDTFETAYEDDGHVWI